MAVKTSGRLQMRGESGPGLPVQVRAGEGQLRILSGAELVGEWIISEIGIHDLPEGFAIRAEGEEFVLIPDDEVSLAEEFGLAAATPRLARRVAASHNPEPHDFTEGVNGPSDATSTNTAALAFALGGVLVVLGGAVLRATSATTGAGRLWLIFVAGGLLMVAAALSMSLGAGWSRLIALLIVGAVIIGFVYVVSSTEVDSGLVAGYGFIAGGLVVAVAVLSSGSLRPTT